ncbi:MAG: FkbM family methyltransferase [Gammaproteobacteria bacterium]|nr:FkbM family methyltransferase [Gammaproteobacteria bacterium]
MDAKIEKNKSIYGEAATTSASSADTKTFGIIKLLLRKTGLLPFFRWTKNSLFSPNKRLKKLSRFKTTIGGHDIQFSTEDEYSNNWFYPRYVGGRIHEKNVTNTLIKELASAQCFVDVGTNLGWYTCVASKALPHGKIYGFEMDQLNFDLLKKNIELNECQNVEIFNYAVSDAPGEVVYQRPCDTPSPTFRIHRELEKQTTNDMG